MASATLVFCEIRNSLGLWECARNIPKCEGTVFRSWVTRILAPRAAIASTSLSGTDSNLAAFAPRKSTDGSTRIIPLTIASRKLASTSNLITIA